MSQMNQGPGMGQGPQSGRPGQMTAVMRAMSQATGPKVLRIGLVAAGRILEERIVKQRTSVTVGPSEKSMFVVQANVPAGFKLFELIGTDYYLNFLDGMTGRVALATGITDLVALKGQAKRVGPAYQVRLTDEARGKVVVGETTFLFQFVAPPPIQPRPQLPLSVKGGLASQIDWNLTIIAAFSFLLHFGLIGAMYSDWMDPVVNDDLAASLAHVVQTPAEPPPIETAEPTASATTADTSAPAPTNKPSTPSKAPSNNTPAAPAATVVAGLLNQAEQARIAILAALNGGPNIAGAMKDDNGAPVDLNSLATREGGISNSTSGLNLPGGANGPIKPGTGPGGLQNLHGDGTGPAVNGAGTITKVVPVGDANFGGASASVPVSNAEAVIRSQLQPRARACYNAALAQDPTISGKLVISMQIGADGGVTGVSASGMGGQIAGCISAAARRLQFASPGGSGSTISTSFNFVKQGGG